MGKKHFFRSSRKQKKLLDTLHSQALLKAKYDVLTKRGELLKEIAEEAKRGWQITKTYVSQAVPIVGLVEDDIYLKNK